MMLRMTWRPREVHFEHDAPHDVEAARSRRQAEIPRTDLKLHSEDVDRRSIVVRVHLLSGEIQPHEDQVNEVVLREEEVHSEAINPEIKWHARKQSRPLQIQ